MPILQFFIQTKGQTDKNGQMEKLNKNPNRCCKKYPRKRGETHGSNIYLEHIIILFVFKSISFIKNSLRYHNIIFELLIIEQNYYLQCFIVYFSIYSDLNPSRILSKSSKFSFLLETGELTVRSNDDKISSNSAKSRVFSLFVSTVL